MKKLFSVLLFIFATFNIHAVYVHVHHGILEPYDSIKLDGTYIYTKAELNGYATVDNVMINSDDNKTVYIWEIYEVSSTWSGCGHNSVGYRYKLLREANEHEVEVWHKYDNAGFFRKYDVVHNTYHLRWGRVWICSSIAFFIVLFFLFIFKGDVFF